MNRSVLIFVTFLIALLASIPSYGQCAEASEDCAAIGQWEISVGLGAGTLTNPLVGGSNFPLVVLPYIHYYQERFYIENNQIGYSFFQHPNIVVSAVTQLNRESAFFSDWSPTHLLLPSVFETVMDQAIPLSIDIQDVSNRKWALDAGLQLNWFIGEKSEVKIQILHDVNSAYNGFNGQLSYYYNWTPTFIAHSQFRFGAGVNWQSKELINYYYGIGASDNVDPSFYYQTESGLNPFASINFAKHLSSNWKLHSFIRYEKLSSEVQNSPLVNDSNITSVFLGAVYVF